jgi:hypothetical protein
MKLIHGCTQRHKRTKDNPEWRAYCVWQGMRARCYRESDPNFKNYGGRGISVCDRWQDFQNFYRDMGAPPLGRTIERVNNDGNYEPSNCEWATRATQSANRRNRREFTHDGRTMSLSEWARHLGVPRRLLQVRMDRGWSVAEMLNPQLRDTRFKRKAG